jgi:hypothetical protein
MKSIRTSWSMRTGFSNPLACKNRTRKSFERVDELAQEGHPLTPLYGLAGPTSGTHLASSHPKIGNG